LADVPISQDGCKERYRLLVPRVFVPVNELQGIRPEKFGPVILASEAIKKIPELHGDQIYRSAHREFNI
jgi:hypothetical protein